MSDTTTRLDSNKILVVDDATANLRLLMNLLTEQGYDVHPASDGELALEFVNSTLPDIILLDIKLPGMDGYEVCRRLKADERTRSIPIIFISILEDEGDKVKGFQAGGVDYITKPFRQEEVLARVKTHLRLQQLTNRLDQEVRERTEELATTNQRLRHELAERRRAETLLRESEEKYRGLIQRIQAAVVVHGADTRILTSNPRAQQLLGLTEAQVTGRSAMDPDWHFFREDGTPMPLEEYPVNRVLKTGRPLRDAVAGVHRSATMDDVWVLVSADPVVDGQGKIIQVIVTFVDITERKKAQAENKKAERRLLASEQLFRAMVENSPDFIARYDREFRRIYVNPAILKLFGDQEKNVIGKTPADQSPLYAPRVYMDHLRQVFETATERSSEIPFRTAQGEMHWGHNRFVPEFGPDGKVVSVLAIGRDIHEIKENEQRFRMLAENFPDFVVRFDRDGRFTYVNPAVEKAFGMPADVIIGKTLHQLPLQSKPEQNDAHLALIRRTFDEGMANESEVRWEAVLRDRIFEVRHAPEKDAAGNVVSVLGIARDITERKRAREEIRRLNEELEQRVRDRTAQLEAANKELQGFTYLVSHDLRAPLRHIDGFLELLQMRVGTALDEESRRYMDNIFDAAERMGRLVDDLLSFSRMGQHAMSVQPVDMGEMVRGTLREFEPDIAGRNIHWRIGELPVLNGDMAMLRIAMVNLISNALKFTRPRREARIEIGALPGQEPEAVIFVRDNGVGFDMAHADKLFDAFQRLHRADEFEGTGIGLANVRRIITRHGGRTWAEGKPDRGATFYVGLPRTSKGGGHEKP